MYKCGCSFITVAEKPLPAVIFPYQNSKFYIGVNRPLIRGGGKQSGATETF